MVAKVDSTRLISPPWTWTNTIVKGSSRPSTTISLVVLVLRVRLTVSPPFGTFVRAKGGQSSSLNDLARGEP